MAMAGFPALTVLILPLLPADISGAAPSGPPTNPVHHITAKTRTQIAFRLAGAKSPVARYAIGSVRKDGKAIRAPKGMKLDAGTGRFSWQPTESQAGTYEVEFLITEPPPRLNSTATRRITVEAREVTTDRGEVGRLLRKWYADGTAAGNTGDFYDNRDRGHSRLNAAKFPQLDRVEYPDELKQRRLDWGLQVRFLFPHVTIGNSSTSSSPTTGGCNSRRALMSPRAVAMIQRQYRNGHLYVYPEHRDHDPGRNGRGGYGDLFPANVPYLITSQGSSGSDRPFVEAVAFTLAAFRPEVKKRLIETGLLMPTVQMIFRSCNRGANHRKDYLTGKAHPTAFEGSDVDAAAMVRLAHEIRSETIPPIVQLAVVEEDQARPGRDYFDTGRPEKLFDTPAAIARIARSTKYRRRMVLSAKGSYDVNRRELTYHWAVLRGDAERIRIKPRNKAASEVELLVCHHERRPIRPGAKIESSRVDVGAFVHNGAYYSAPAFVCFYWLADEARTYHPDGRVLEVGYDYADSTIGYPTDNPRDGRYHVTDWQAFLELASPGGKGFAAQLLQKRLPALARIEFRRAANELAEAAAREAAPKQACDAAEAARKKARSAETDARKKLDEANKAPGENAKLLEDARRRLERAAENRKAADKRLNDAGRRLREAQKAATAALTKKRPGLANAESVKARLEKELNAIRSDVRFYIENAGEIHRLHEACRDAGRKKAFAAARDELLRGGILKADGKGGYRLSPLIDGPGPAERRLSTYQRNRIERFHVAILEDLVYPGMLNVPCRRNFVSPYLAAPKNWRDVYHYDDKGRLIGWTRHTAGKTEHFTADGMLVAKSDKLGRPIEARKVQYLLDRDSRGRPRELKYMALPAVIRYEYASMTDRVGRIRGSQ